MSPPNAMPQAENAAPITANSDPISAFETGGKIYLEDFVVGKSHQFGAVTLSETEIIEFAKLYDPQPFHTDPQAGADSPFGGLIASGWQTACLAMRLLCDAYILRSASLGSPGVDELRWTKPVRPGDTLSVRVTPNDVRPSRSKPDRGTVHSLTEILNQDGDVVMTMRGMGMFLRRPNR